MNQEGEAAVPATHINLGKCSGSPPALEGEAAHLQWASGARWPWTAPGRKGRSAGMEEQEGTG